MQHKQYAFQNISNKSKNIRLVAIQIDDSQINQRFKKKTLSQQQSKIWHRY